MTDPDLQQRPADATTVQLVQQFDAAPPQPEQTLANVKEDVHAIRKGGSR